MIPRKLPAYLTTALADLCAASQGDALACGAPVSMANSTAHKNAVKAIRRYAGQDLEARTKAQVQAQLEASAYPMIHAAQATSAEQHVAGLLLACINGATRSALDSGAPYTAVETESGSGWWYVQDRAGVNVLSFHPNTWKFTTKPLAKAIAQKWMQDSKPKEAASHDRPPAARKDAALQVAVLGDVP